MSAASFIRDALIRGTLTYEELGLLVAGYQRSLSMDEVDGKPGPVTLAAMHKAELHDHVAVAHMEYRTWDTCAVPGTRVNLYMGAEGHPKAAWCAGFGAWCLLRAGMDGPVSGPPRRGARALIEWLVTDGGWTWVVSPDEPGTILPRLHRGDAVVWRRPGGWKGHFAFMFDAQTRMATIAGNENRGQIRIRSFEDMDAFRTGNGSFPHGLYAIARPPYRGRP